MAAMGWFDRLVFVVFWGVGAVCNGSAMRQSFGNNDKTARTVSIQDSVPPPTFLPGPSEVTVRQGEVAVLPCAVRHLGPKQVAWRRIDAHFPLTIGRMTWTDDVRFSVDHIPRENDAGDWNLVIDTVTQDDVGVYKCQVLSRLGLNKLVELKVVGPPVRDPVISIKGRPYVDLGQKIHLVCNASGGPRLPEDIDWFKDGVKINSFRYPRVLIEEYQSIRDRAFISELMIDHAEESDAGVYVCRSSKNAVDSMKITVLKETKPTDTTRRETEPTDTTRRETKPTDPTRTGHTSIDIFRVTQSC